MRLINIIILGSVLLSSNVSAQLNYSSKIDKGKTYKVVLLAGQSNMVGVGKVSELDNKSLPENIVYFNFGMNPDFSSSPNSFGPEVGVSEQLEKHFPDTNFILIKYAIGGSSQLDWALEYDPEKAKITGFPQFGNMYDTYQQKIDSIITGLDAEIVALLWMQGERDARVSESGVNYFENFSKLIKAFRKDAGNDNLPVIFGEINPRIELYPALDTVRSAQLKVAQEVKNVYLIETDDLSKWDDHVHYDTRGQLELGKRMGEKLIEVLE